MEGGVAEGEETTVGAYEVIAPGVAGGGDGHYVRDALTEARQVAVVPGVTEGVDRSVGCHHPVALGRQGGGNAHDVPCNCRCSDVPERLCCSRAVHLAVRGGQPVPGGG